MTLRLPQRRRRSGGTQMRRRGIRGTVISRGTIYTIADRGVRGGLTKRLGGVVRNAKRHRVVLDGPTFVFPQLTRPRGGESGHRTQIRHRATLTRTLRALVLIGSDGARRARRRRAARALRPGPAILARAVRDVLPARARLRDDPGGAYRDENHQRDERARRETRRHPFEPRANRTAIASSRRRARASRASRDGGTTDERR